MAPAAAASLVVRLEAVRWRVVDVQEGLEAEKVTAEVEKEEEVEEDQGVGSWGRVVETQEAPLAARAAEDWQ